MKTGTHTQVPDPMTRYYLHAERICLAHLDILTS